MDLQLGGRVALITGGSRGLGRVLAESCARAGMKVAICARTPSHLEDCAASVRALGAPCLILPADLFDGAACREVVERTASEFGRLDVLINNASTAVSGAPASILDLSEAQLSERFIGKTLAAIRCAQAAVPHMRRAGGGRIISIGGTAARTIFRAGESATPSTALPQGLGNAALANFSKYLAEEVARDQILVNLIHPHTLHSSRRVERLKQRAAQSGRPVAELEAELAERVPIGRLVKPEDIAPLVLFLASPHASAITGQSITVDGGALRNIDY